MIDTIAVIGAGNGGKASAVDLSLQGKHVRLFEFPEFKSNIEGLVEHPTLTATGAVAGEGSPRSCDHGSFGSRVRCGHDHGLHPGAGPRSDRAGSGSPG